MNEYDATKPFFMAICQTNPGKFDLSSNLPEHFETQKKAQAYLDEEHRMSGIGGSIFHCTPVSHVEFGPVPDDEEV